jgi:molybdopterin converting factor subunit 1
MQVRVHLFARFRDLVGAEVVTLTLPDAATVRDLRHCLALAYPALAPLLERSAVAVNNDFAEDNRLIGADAEIALLPPVSGG